MQRRRLLGPFSNDLVFHIMNVMTLGSVSAILRDLWHAQGVNVTIRRRMTKHPRKSWKRCHNLKKEEWRAIGIMVNHLSFGIVIPHLHSFLPVDVDDHRRGCVAYALRYR